MVSILIEKLLGISCFGKCISHPDKNFVATLVWKRIRNPKLTPIMNDRNDNGELDHVKNYIFELDIARVIVLLGCCSLAGWLCVLLGLDSGRSAWVYWLLHL